MIEKYREDWEFIQKCCRNEDGSWAEFMNRHGYAIKMYVAGYAKTYGVPGQYNR